MRWLNEPAEWSAAQGIIRAVTGEKTDFWRETFYGFVRDDGHFYGQEVTGDFTAQVTLTGDYDKLYDQSGLMLRVDERNWVKTGLEFTDGAVHLSTVVTRGFSDWSMVPVPRFDGSLTLRLTRHGEAVRVQHLSGDGWRLLRLGYLDMPATVHGWYQSRPIMWWPGDTPPAGFPGAGLVVVGHVVAWIVAGPAGLGR